MAVIKCKMCGGDLNLITGEAVAECVYCGSRQTVPTVDSEKMLTLFARANRLRFGCEFDKAAGVYESIVADFPEEAEAYWGLFLCKYGIEYVDDPATGKKVPTCHRSSFDSAMDDVNLEQACENADAIARRVYRDEAKAIEELRKSIIEVSGKEEPYDIFICYKETADNGERTLDSVLAQDIYTALTEKGYRVFFSRVTLEDKLGQEYEPYIFAALHSAKVMLAVGTDYEHYNAVWVKNEWNRFLALIAGGEKKTLIPCYKGIDAYDMPKEFARLQAQDMGKVGAAQDLLRGIEKLLPKTGGSPQLQPQPQPQTPTAPDIGSLCERGNLFLEDGEWESADAYFDRALDIDPKYAMAYVGKLCAELRVKSVEGLAEYKEPFDSRNNYQKAVRFADDKLKTAIIGYATAITDTKADAINEAVRIVNEYLNQQAAKGTNDNPHDLIESEGKKPIERSELSKAIVLLRSENKLELIDKRLLRVIAVSASHTHTVGLQVAGTVVATKFTGKIYFGKCDVFDWTDIVAVTAGGNITVGLRADGTVVVAGRAIGDVSGWRNIVAVSAGIANIAGLKADGTVVTAGYNDDDQREVSGWKDIVAVSAGYSHTAGLKADGTVVAVGDNNRGRCDVSGWKDIAAVSAGYSHTVGLKTDGTVVAVGDNNSDQCEVSDWKDIVAVSAGGLHTAGLKANGTVVVTGSNRNDHCDVSGWTDIVAVAAGFAYIVGLKADGTVAAVGKNDEGQCNVSGWCGTEAP